MEEINKKFEWIHQRLKIKISKKLLKSFEVPEKFTMLNLAIKRFESSFHVKFTKKEYQEILEKFVNDSELENHFNRKFINEEYYSMLSLSLIKKNKDGGKYIPENIKITPLKIKNYPELSLEEFDKAIFNLDMVFQFFEIEIDWFLSFDNQDKLRFAIEQIIFETIIFSEQKDFKNYIENMYYDSFFEELYEDKLLLSF